ncbi:MAG: Protein translocase subunit SecF [Parcubacteria group bacterium GW2011_GWB1_46_8]
MKLNIIGARKIFYIFSGISIFLSCLALVVWGLKPGIDFTGGALWEFKFGNPMDKIVLEQQLETIMKTDVLISESSDGIFSARMKEFSEQEHQGFVQELEKSDESFEELRWETVGPTVGKTLRDKSMVAIVMVVVGISVYIAFAFRKASYPVSSIKYGLITVLTLFHDVIIPIGAFCALAYFQHVEIDTNFVVAILVIMGFSVHDTIVVFDRVREKLMRFNGKDFGALVNESLNETLVRSFNTSLTVVFVLLAMFFWGGAVLKYFILAMLIGMIVGMYSSIFIASPLLVDVWKWQQKRK